MVTLNQLKEDGSMNALKWMLIFMIIFFFIGYLFAVIKVTYFEQTESGKYAVHNECVNWNKSCIKSCEDAIDYFTSPPSCDECCIKYENKVTPMGVRLKNLGIRYGLIASGIGMTVGLIVAEEKRKSLLPDTPF